MNVTSVQILNRGIANKECLYFKVLTAFNLAYLVAFETSYISQQAVVNAGRRSYWFPSKIVKPGDHVFLYTSPGANGETLHTDGTTILSFYWGFTETIWNQPTSCALVFEITSWQATLYPK